MSDNLTDRLQRAADRFVAASLERGFIYGTQGRKNENGSYSVVVAGRPNYLYVTVDGEQASTIARGGATPRVAGLPVRMKREQGELVIVDVNQLALGAFLSGGAGGYNVAFHHHNEGSGLEYAINSSRLKPGRVRYVEALTVHIGEFAYSHLGDWRWWPGGNIDLTSVKPATAGEWAWVLVGVDPSTNAAVAVAGAAVAVGVELTVDLIEAIAFNGYIPCGAVRMRADDTALNLASRYADARIWLDRLGASGGGDVAAEIDGADEKVAPDGTDKFGLVEGGLLKWLSWTNLVAGVQAALDSLYFRLTGRAGGQVAHGGTGSGDTLTLRGSAHATQGPVIVLGTNFDVNETRAGVNATAFVTARQENQRNAQIIFLALDGSGGGIAATIGIRGASGNGLAFRGDGGGLSTPHVFLASNGRLGIGTVTPETRLHIHDGEGRFLFNASSVTSGYATRFTMDDTGAYILGGSALRDLVFGANSLTNQLVLKPAGNVGIGTTSPQARVHAALEAGGGFAAKSVSGVAGTAVTLLPAGTVTGKLQASGAVVTSGGVSSTFAIALSGGSTQLTPGGGAVIIFTAPSGDLELRVESNGSVTTRRISGSVTFSVALSMVWL